MSKKALLAILAIAAPLATARFSFNLGVHGQNGGDECWTEWNVWDDHVPLNRDNGPYECRKDGNVYGPFPQFDSSSWNEGTSDSARISWQDGTPGDNCVRYNRYGYSTCMNYHVTAGDNGVAWLAGDDSGAWVCDTYAYQGYGFCK